MGSLIVLPTYQEAANIAAVLRRIRASVPSVACPRRRRRQPRRHGRAGRCGRRRARRHRGHAPAGEAGLGSAYRDGMRWGLRRGYDVLVEMDADLSHDPADLPRLIGAVEDGADLAVGSRYVTGGSIPEWSLAPAHPFPAGQSLRGRPAASAGDRRHVGVPGLPGGRPGGRRPGSGPGRRLRLPDRDGVPHRRPRGHGGRAADLLHRASLGRSKMSARIVIEAFALVTWWGLRDRLTGQHPTKTRV